MNTTFSWDSQDSEVRIIALIARQLKLSVDTLDVQRDFTALGINSLKSVEMVEALNQELGLDLGVEIVFDYSDTQSLAAYIVQTYYPASEQQMTGLQDQALAVEGKLKAVIANILQKTSGTLDTAKNFAALGISSIVAVEMVAAINRELGLDLGVEVIFDYESIHELTHYIVNQHSETIGASRQQEVSSVQEQPADIAIIGISGKFANSDSIAQFWMHLLAGESCIEEIRRPGWDEHDYYDPDPARKNTSISKWGGMVRDIDQFDAAFFAISASEAKSMDPQQRLFLQEAFKAIEDSGYAGEQLAGKKVGVYVGGRNSSYKENALAEVDSDAHLFLGNEMSMLASRLSYFLNLKGPGLVVDTACSSSLVAMHLACESIRRGESEMAVAGGVFILSSPEFFVMSSKMGTLSPDGICRTFDNDANGMVLGEGVGVVVLKQLARAKRDKDHIYAVIKGSAVNQTGKSNGITAPSMQAQKELILDAYRNAAINPETVSYIEAHGTATRLGDAIEVKALTEAFGLFTQKKQFCTLGSHKPNFGHTTLSAGIAGIFKVLMAMKYHVIPPTISVKKINKNIDLKNSPFVINTHLQTWQRQEGAPLRAGINALGSNGTNCHLILEEPLVREQSDAAPGRPAYLFPFSARTKSALAQKMHDMVAWLEEEVGDHRLAEIAYTLAVGRSHYPVRCALIAGTREELQQKISLVCQRGTAADYFFSEETDVTKVNATLSKHQERLSADLQRFQDFSLDDYKKTLSELADVYCRRGAIDWEKIFSDFSYSRISLPTYPFSGERYWFSEVLPTPALGPAFSPFPQTSLLSMLDQTYQRSRREMDELLGTLLWVQLRSTGCFVRERATAVDIRSAGALLPRYERWLEESLAILVRQRYLSYDGVSYTVSRAAPIDGNTAWSEWQDKKKAWLRDPNLKAQVVLVEATLTALPVILTGKRLATDILFPHSSMELVQDIYKNNPLADYCNAMLAESVVDYVRERLRKDPAARLRLLEIGAGTGGTSTIVFEKLKPYQAHIQEYCYTDLSKAFLLYAEKTYGPHYPYLVYSILNVEEPVAGQHVETQGYDLVIAANVLHATKNIQRTLRNTKALLQKKGLLLLNEISSNSSFLHLTFGLLEGWWLYEDEALRLDHSPALAPMSWQKILVQEGYASVRFLAPEAHTLGQQVIAAESDGVIQVSPFIVQASVERRSLLSSSTESKNPTSRQNHMQLTITDQMIEDHVREIIVERLAEALEVHADVIDTEEAFRDYGLDSILSVNLIQVINQELKIEVDTTILFDYSSVRQLSSYIVSHYNDQLRSLLGQSNEQGNGSEAAIQIVQQEEPLTQSNLSIVEPEAELFQPVQLGEPIGRGVQREAIAIVGVSGRFAQAQNVEELWQHFAQGKDLMRPFTRWDLTHHTQSEKHAVNQGALLEDIDLFDPLFFNISGLEATYTDPQQRLFLEEAWKSLEDAGYAGEAIVGKRCGVYVGCMKGDYQQLIGNDAPAQAFWGNMESIVSARIAYYLNLQGPAITVDTACSSSLVAIHVACQGLWTGEIEMAVAGGVFVQATPAFYLSAQRAGMISPSGHCYTFDERADGFAPGEGVGVVVLKRLSDALAAGDHIHGVIKGSGINQDGTTNGITAPSALAQERLERDVYDTFQIHPEQIQMVEAHGTGTRLGDPIEFQALSRAFRHYTQKKQYCAIGSAKTNIGHTQIAAGMVGLIKILASLRHRQIPPSLHFQTCNASIALADSPFYVNTRLQAWEVEAQAKRSAVLSSFGASGTNAHMVIEEAPAVVSHHAERLGYVIVLSARTSEQLRAQVEQLVQVGEQDTTMDCGNISYTLLLGRKHFPHRLACVVHNLAELMRFLRRWLERGKVAQIYVAELREHEHREQPALKRYGNQCIQSCLQAPFAPDYLEQLATVAELYVQGYSLNFAELFSQDQYHRISLPTYPFARERYWVPEPQQSSDPQRNATPAALAQSQWLHPLLQQNTSDFSAQRFTSQWTGQEFFLSDHVVKGQRVLPGVAYLEMARAAVLRAVGRQAEGQTHVCLADVVWSSPIVVGEEPVQVHIGLVPQENGEVNFEVYSLPALKDVERLIHSQGRAMLKPARTIASRNLSQLLEQCQQRELSADQFYAFFKCIGINYGPGHRGIQRLYRGAEQVLAKLVLPGVLTNTREQFVLHPCLMDSALQASVELMLNSEKVLLAPGQALYNPVMPFALEELEILGPCTPTMWALVRYCNGSKSGDRVEKFDIDLYDDQGMPRVYMRGFSARALEGQLHSQNGTSSPSIKQNGRLPSLETLMHMPVWDVVPLLKGQSVPTPGAQVLIVGNASEQGDAIQHRYPDAHRLPLRPQENIQSLVEQLEKYSSLDHIVWLAPQHPLALVSEENVITGQDQGVLHLFRLVKALLRLGYGEKKLGWTVLTVQAQPVHAHEQVNPTHASVHGFVGALAKEYPDWSLRLVDLPVQERWPLADIFALAAEPHGHAWVYRRGRWYRQQIIPLQKPAAQQTLYRERGVYVVIGGAGGLGEVWSEYMINSYQAQVVWIGRRPLDEVIRVKIERLAKLGPAPYYIAVDATDQHALQEGYAEIKRRYGQVHGVIHAAIRLLDKSLANMDEERFRAGLAAKVDVCVRLAQVFAQKTLDFALFFSSINSFTKAAGQSNYASGCTFEDAFAHQLACEWPCAVKLINWGYWGSVGVVASREYRERLAYLGMGSIEPPEAMEALELLLAGHVDHMIMMKVTKPMVLDGMNAEETITIYPEKIHSLIQHIKDSLPKDGLRFEYVQAGKGR